MRVGKERKRAFLHDRIRIRSFIRTSSQLVAVPIAPPSPLDQSGMGGGVIRPHQPLSNTLMERSAIYASYVALPGLEASPVTIVGDQQRLSGRNFP